VDEDRLGGVGLAVFGGSFDELAGLEAGAGPDERNEVRGVDRARAVLGGLEELGRHGQSRGPGSRAAGLAMAFKLIEAAQDRWRAVNGPHLVALVRAGATFVNGKLVERPDEQDQPDAA